MKSFNPLESGFPEKNVTDNSPFILLCVISLTVACISLYFYHQLSEKIKEN